MRTKEQAQDYRFISEPDLPLIKLENQRVQKIKQQLPETPHVKLKRLIKKHKIEPKHAEILTKKLDIVEFFEQIVDKIHPKLATPWTTIELLSVLNYNKKELEDIDINPEHFIELLQLLEKKAITELKAQEILRKFVPKSKSPKALAKAHSTISGKSEIQKIVQQIIKQNPQAIKDYKSGKQESLNFLIGQIMRKSNKRADYKVAKELLVKSI
jgi:aspartyl-tRNA(Asn)/glutamyl-tRNA(Gln) amidotransferase subunit B